MDFLSKPPERPGINTSNENRSLNSPKLPDIVGPAMRTPSPMSAPAFEILDDENQPKKYINSKEELLKIDDRKIIEMNIPEWGATIRLRPLTGAARDKWEGDNQTKGGGVNYNNIRARLAALCIVDESGNLMFTPKDVAELGNKSSIVLHRIFEKIQGLNALTEKDIEEMAKN